MPRGKNADMSMSDFELGTPALVCRWRLANRRLPLCNRHLRALLARTVRGEQVSKELVAWAKQHIEWTLDQGAVDHPNGVLMLMIDDGGRAAMTVGPYEPLAGTSLAELARRAEHAALEGAQSHVAPETLWVARGDELLWDPGSEGVASGAASLVGQLAQTLGIEVHQRAGLLEGMANGALTFDEAFLVSDEHGIVAAHDCQGRHGRRMEEAYERLLERA